MKANTIQFKIGILYTGILGAILLIYSLIVIGVLQQTLSRDIDKQLEIKSREVAALVDALAKTQLAASVYHVTALNAASHRIMELHRMNYAEAVTALEARVLEMMDRYELHDDYFAITNSDGKLIASSQNTPPELQKMLLENIIARITQNRRFSTVNFHSKKIRIATTRIQMLHGPAYFIQIASSLGSVDRASRKLFIVILFILPLTMLLTRFTGRMLISKILKPVSVVAKAAQSITHEDLSHRVRDEHADSEMQELIRAFNLMIERLEKSFGHISEFSTHVAHELKTPLAVIRGESELALRKERSPAEYREALEANLRETERMIRIIEDMLFLARVDYDPQSLNFQPVDLTEMLTDITEKERVLAERKKIELRTTFQPEKFLVSGDSVHLRRLFFNILDNAIKFTPESGWVSLTLKTENKNAVIQVTDSGPGIPPDDLPRIFEKFFHRDHSGKSPGNGLGLSIALSIALAHQGSLSAKNTPGAGATFTISLPLKNG